MFRGFDKKSSHVLLAALSCKNEFFLNTFTKFLRIIGGAIAPPVPPVASPLEFDHFDVDNSYPTSSFKDRNIMELDFVYKQLLDEHKACKTTLSLT